jgi:hypothetical protein
MATLPVRPNAFLRRALLLGLALPVLIAAAPPEEGDGGLTAPGAASAGAATGAHGGKIIEGEIRSYHEFQRDAVEPGIEIDPSLISFEDLFVALGPEATQWYQHVVTLSNPYFEGRAPGSEGIGHAADYIEFYFRQIGLEPAFPAPEIDPAQVSPDWRDEAAPPDGANASSAPAAATGDEPGGGAAAAWTTYRQPFTVRNTGQQEAMLTNRVWTENVGGVLPGRGGLAGEWIVIGAHYDHVGYGRRRIAYEGEGEARVAVGIEGDPGPVHTGADDNASGTSAMLVLAKRLAAAYADSAEGASLRSILFMAFSAEEMGLLGSRHYTRNATIEASNIDAMINLDMVGRLRTNMLAVGGVGTAEGFMDVLRPHFERSDLIIYADPNGTGPSDHASFYGSDVPVLFFFTGTHSVYHRPGDQGYTVDPEGAARIIDLTGDIAWDLATRPERLKFVRVAGADDGERPRSRAPRASLGIMPDMDAQVETGILIGQVFDGTAAADAGLRKGDLIVAWNGQPIAGRNDLFARLGESKPGDLVTLEVIRDAVKTEVKVTLRERGQ